MKTSSLRRIIREEISRVQSKMLSAMQGNAKQIQWYSERISSFEDHLTSDELKKLGKLSGQLVKLEKDLYRIAQQLDARAGKGKDWKAGQM